MPVNCHQLQEIIEDPFEREVFQTVCRNLRNTRGNYQVIGPFYIPGTHREIDGLVVSPYCVFTVEAKSHKGKVSKELNSDIRVVTQDGKLHEFGERHEKPYQQTQNQWKSFKDFLRREFGSDGIWVKSALIFPSGSAFHVPKENRDNSNTEVPFIGTPEELSRLVQTLKPDRGVRLDHNFQNEIVGLIEESAVLEPALARHSASQGRASPDLWAELLNTFLGSNKPSGKSGGYQATQGFSLMKTCVLPIGLFLFIWFCMVISCIYSILASIVGYFENLFNQLLY